MPAMAHRRIVVLAIDGTPHSLLVRLIADGVMPNLAKLVPAGSLRRIRSVFPTVSNCAWTSFMTGKDPGGHHVYGFVDRVPESWEIFLPTARDRAGEAIWERLSRQGRRVCVINVPGTYPPVPVNGVMVTDFMTPSVEKLSLDPHVVDVLKSLRYRIDVDGWQGRKDPDALVRDVHDVIDARFRVAFHFLRQEPWDFFMTHVMAVDRLQHFLWEQQEKGEAKWRAAFLDVYRKVDANIGLVLDEIRDDAEFVVLSDHGFCAIKREVQVNRWLEEQGWLVLKPERDPKAYLRNVDAARTRAYSLIPGRIFVNLKGREPGGTVEPGADYERLRREIAERLLDLVDPADGARVIDFVMKREDAYRGGALGGAADLVAHPVNGYDLKGTVVADRIWQRTALTGMHTYDDAFLLVRGQQAPPAEDLSIVDAHDVVTSLMGGGSPPA
jgi:predicted AlkP superfamily phosphohydrolase/phosphomutase